MISAVCVDYKTHVTNNKILLWLQPKGALPFLAKHIPRVNQLA